MSKQEPHSLFVAGPSTDFKIEGPIQNSSENVLLGVQNLLLNENLSRELFRKAFYFWRDFLGVLKDSFGGDYIPRIWLADEAVGMVCIYTNELNAPSEVKRSLPHWEYRKLGYQTLPLKDFNFEELAGMWLLSAPSQDFVCSLEVDFPKTGVLRTYHRFSITFSPLSPSLLLINNNLPFDGAFSKLIKNDFREGGYVHLFSGNAFHEASLQNLIAKSPALARLITHDDNLLRKLWP